MTDQPSDSGQQRASGRQADSGLSTESAAGVSEAPDFLVIGEALIDIVRSAAESPAADAGGAGDTEQAEHVGGSPANVALGLSRLGHAATLATALGRDAHADRITGHLQASGVRITPGSYCQERTATAIATLDEQQAATYDFDIDWRFDPSDLGTAATTPLHVHTGSIAAYLEPGGSAVADFAADLRNSATLSFDPNIRPSLLDSKPGPGWVRERTERLVGAAHVVKASDEDLEFLYPGVPAEDTAAAWSVLVGPAPKADGPTAPGSSGRPRLVVITRGANGAIAVVGGQVREFAAPRVSVVDTVGAGDSFMAGLLSGLADLGLLGPDATGRPVDEDGTARTTPAAQTVPDPVAVLNRVTPAIERALACAALTVQRSGADLPRKADLSSQALPYCGTMR